MATSTLFHLQPPAVVEDVMEMSSPAHGAHDDEIEIDFDDHFETNVDDQMQEDVQSLQFHDDEMQDEEQSLALQPPASTTQPGHVDDDLIDYSDEEDLEPIKAQEHVEVEKDDVTAPAPSEVVDDDDWPAGNDADADALDDSAPVLVFEEHDELTGGPEDDREEAIALATEVDETQTLQNDIRAASVAAVSPVAAKQEHDSETQPQLDTTVQAVVAEVGTPTDTGLHPMMLYYDEFAFPMFRAKSSPDGLLKDDNLVSVSLADLMKSCRQRLTLKTQNDIDDSYEMLFLFNSLQLSVTEDSPASFQTSLKDVLDVYVQLHENEGYAPEDIPIFEITCSLQMKFHSSIRTLQQAAASGEGISKFAQYDAADDIQHDDHHEEDTYVEEQAEEVEEVGLDEEPDLEPIHQGIEHGNDESTTDAAAEGSQAEAHVHDNQSVVEVADEDYGDEENNNANEAEIAEYQDESFDTTHEIPHDAEDDDPSQHDASAANDTNHDEDIEERLETTAETATASEMREEAANEPREIDATEIEEPFDAADSHTMSPKSLMAVQPESETAILDGDQIDNIEDDFDFVVDDDDEIDTAEGPPSKTTPIKRVREADEDELDTSTTTKKPRPS